MTPYTVFDSKEDLLRAMVARTLTVPSFELADGSWEQRMREAIRETPVLSGIAEPEQ